MSLTQQEKELAAKIGFDESVLLLLKAETNGEIVQLTGRDPNGLDPDSEAIVDLAGVAATVLDKQLNLSQLCERLPSGYVVAWTQRGSYTPYKIAILKTADRYDFLRIMQTNGTNNGVSNEDVIDKLREWEQNYEFNIFEVGFDLVTLEFKTLPESICAFAEEVYEFCPDAVDQGVGIQYNPIDDPEVFAAANQLCPQLSVDYDSNQDEDRGQIAEIIAQLIPQPPKTAEQTEQMERILSLAAELEEMGRTASKSEGIKLLAYEMQKTKFLGLWWD